MNMAKKVNTNISLDPELKKQAVELFQSFGLDLSTAISLFLSQSVREGKIPFEIRNIKTKVIVEEHSDDTHQEEFMKYIGE
jgi:DNA-damage-inducible protein J